MAAAFGSHSQSGGVGGGSCRWTGLLQNAPLFKGTSRDPQPPLAASPLSSGHRHLLNMAFLGRPSAAKPECPSPRSFAPDACLLPQILNCFDFSCPALFCGGRSPGVVCGFGGKPIGCSFCGFASQPGYVRLVGSPLPGFAQVPPPERAQVVPGLPAGQCTVTSGYPGHQLGSE